jgi:hypothetical protein
MLNVWLFVTSSSLVHNTPESISAPEKENEMESSASAVEKLSPVEENIESSLGNVYGALHEIDQCRRTRQIIEYNYH